MAKQELKDFKQRVEEGEFAQSAEISASYLDEDILIIDNVKVLQNPDPVRLQMNMIASCLRGSLKVEYNGNILLVEKGDIFICPPNSTLDIVEVSGDFACTAMCVSNHGMLNILRSHISVWNRAMYVSKVSVLKMNEVDMVFYAKFTDLVRLCLDPSFCERTSWKPYRREIVETLLKRVDLPTPLLP
jgi:AraC family transcriptional regulator, transcriptional activator of pobA